MDNAKAPSNNSRAPPTGGSDGGKEELGSPKTKTKNRAKKRKRSSSESSTEEVMPENTLDMEKSLYASAMKNNLDESSVKKILKKVVTNDHVLAYVKLREEEEDSGTDEGKMKPKLTRAKVKELMKASPQSAAWDLERLELSPIKQLPVKTRPEVTALIAHDLPDEEDDDEYHPTLDDVPSDDDHTCSDLDSQPRTPATPKSVTASSPRVLNDGPFKVPTEVSSAARRRLHTEPLPPPQEDATIALRTRSKLSLSATPIEHIESSFVPPDEVPLPIVDDLWNQFLEECLNPASASRHEDDDDADPEYNVAADPDAPDEDEEALERSIIKISKKELNDLVTELFHIMPEDLETNGKDIRTEYPEPPPLLVPLPLPCPANWKKEPVSDDEVTPLVIANGSRRNSCVSIGKTEPMDMDMEGEPIGGVVEPRSETNGTHQETMASSPKSTSIQIEVQETETSVKPPLNKHKVPPLLENSIKKKKRICIEIQIDADGKHQPKVLPEQLQILQQQLRQHVQLCTSNFLQLYVHPVFWDFAPHFKEYLESFEKVLEKNPQSVVGVCNLRPALELVRSWEASVSDNTPENMSMVKFLQKEVEKCRKRYAQNNLYTGDFHESYKQVIANSPVFLYPYLLPPVPYRSNTTRRAGYVRSEDELIAIGLDQFWQYVEDNPDLYPRDPRTKGQDKRTRWGLTKVVELVCRFMFPFFQPRVVNCHINFVRRSADKDNPIYKFFHSREIVPVKHKLLPFNPNITLYQQPEHEMPLIWIKYIAKSSKRAQAFLKRKIVTNGLKPEGVEVDLGKSVVPPEKRPLPADFTKKIVCTRRNLRPLAIKKNNNIEIQIDPQEKKININPSPAANNVQTASTTNAKLFKVVTNSSGAAYLVPLEVLPCNTTTVTSSANPITTPAVVESSATPITIEAIPNGGLLVKSLDSVNEETESADSNNDKEELVNETDAGRHCKCCALIKKIDKQRQKTITEYFKSKNETAFEVKCPCSSVVSPKITNRLRALLSNYKCQFYVNWRRVEMKLDEYMPETEKKMDFGKRKAPCEEECKPNEDDIAYATKFTLKLLTRLAPVRYMRQKARVESLLTNFDGDSDSPVWLAVRLRDQLENELLDLYRDFAGFLTAEQADKAGAFNNYFVQNCVPDLVTRIDKEVKDTARRHRVLSALRDGLGAGTRSSCELSCSLLTAAGAQPALASYLFSLFPHRRKDCFAAKNPENETARETSESPLLEGTEQGIQPIGEYEADHSSSGEEETVGDSTLVGERRGDNDTTGISVNNTLVEESSSSVVMESTAEHDQTIQAEHRPLDIIKEEPIEQISMDTPEMTVSKTEIEDHESDASLVIMSEEESIKTELSEPWKKEEDKTILVAIKALATKENQDTEKSLEDMNVYRLLSKQLPHRSRGEIRERVSYLLELIALIKNNDL